MGQWNDIDQLEKGTRHGMPRPPRETGHVSVEASQFRFEMFMSVRLCEEVLCQRFGRAVANWNSGWNSWSLANLDIVTVVTIPAFQSL